MPEPQQNVPNEYRALLNPKLLEDSIGVHVVWARVKGYPFWPAQVLSDTAAQKKLSKVNHKRDLDIPVMFFGTLEIAWINKSDIVTFTDGVHRGFLSKGKQKNFQKAIEQVMEFLSIAKKRKAPQYWWCKPPSPSGEDVGKPDSRSPSGSKQAAGAGSKRKESEGSEEGGSSSVEGASSEDEEGGSSGDSQASGSDGEEEEKDEEEEVEEEEEEEEAPAKEIAAPHMKVKSKASAAVPPKPNPAVGAAGRTRSAVPSPTPAGRKVAASGRFVPSRSAPSNGKPAEASLSSRGGDAKPAGRASSCTKADLNGKGVKAVIDGAMAGVSSGRTAGRASQAGAVKGRPSASGADSSVAAMRPPPSKKQHQLLKAEEEAGASPTPNGVVLSPMEMSDSDDVSKLPIEIRRLAGIKIAKRPSASAVLALQLQRCASAPPQLDIDIPAATAATSTHVKKPSATVIALRAAAVSSRLAVSVLVPKDEAVAEKKETAAEGEDMGGYADKLAAPVDAGSDLGSTPATRASSAVKPEDGLPAEGGEADADGVGDEPVSSDCTRAKAGAMDGKHMHVELRRLQLSLETVHGSMSRHGGGGGGEARVLRDRREGLMSSPSGKSAPASGASTPHAQAVSQPDKKPQLQRIKPDKLLPAGTEGASNAAPAAAPAAASPAAAPSPAPAVAAAAAFVAPAAVAVAPTCAAVAPAAVAVAAIAVVAPSTSAHKDVGGPMSREEMLQRKRERERERREAERKRLKRMPAVAACEDGSHDSEPQTQPSGQPPQQQPLHRGVRSARPRLNGEKGGEVGEEEAVESGSDGGEETASVSSDDAAPAARKVLSPRIPLLRRPPRAARPVRAVGPDPEPRLPVCVSDELHLPMPAPPLALRLTSCSQPLLKLKQQHSSGPHVGRGGGSAAGAGSGTPSSPCGGMAAAMVRSGNPSGCSALVGGSSSAFARALPSASGSGGRAGDGSAAAPQARGRGPGGPRGSSPSDPEDTLDAEAVEALQLMGMLGSGGKSHSRPVPVLAPGALHTHSQTHQHPQHSHLHNPQRGLSGNLSVNVGPSSMAADGIREPHMHGLHSFAWPQGEPLLPDLQESFMPPGEWLQVLSPQYELVKRNVWVSRKRPQRIHKDDVSVCACPPPEIQYDADGIPRLEGGGCAEGSCLNRLSFVHCDPRSCPCGELCSNRPFHLMQQPRLQTFLTENRGHGIRAMQTIGRGAFIVEYSGEVLDARELEWRMGEARRANEQHFYIMELAPGLFVDARWKGSVARLLNSSCEPNCETQKWHDAATGEPRIGVFARKDIRPGEELTCDSYLEHYGESAQPAASFQCLCGAPKCRGTMDAQPHKRQDLGRRLELLWEDDGVFYRATIVGYNPATRKHVVLYDDGDKERVCLQEVAHRWLDGNGEAGEIMGGNVGEEGGGAAVAAAGELMPQHQFEELMAGLRTMRADDGPTGMRDHHVEDTAAAAGGAVRGADGRFGARHYGSGGDASLPLKKRGRAGIMGFAAGGESDDANVDFGRRPHAWSDPPKIKFAAVNRHVGPPQHSDSMASLLQAVQAIQDTSSERDEGPEERDDHEVEEGDEHPDHHRHNNQHHQQHHHHHNVSGQHHSHPGQHRRKPRHSDSNRGTGGRFFSAGPPSGRGPCSDRPQALLVNGLMQGLPGASPRSVAAAAAAPVTASLRSPQSIRKPNHSNSHHHNSRNNDNGHEQQPDPPPPFHSAPHSSACRMQQYPGLEELLGIQLAPCSVPLFRQLPVAAPGRASSSPQQQQLQQLSQHPQQPYRHEPQPVVRAPPHVGGGMRVSPIVLSLMMTPTSNGGSGGLDDVQAGHVKHSRGGAGQTGPLGHTAVLPQPGVHCSLPPASSPRSSTPGGPSSSGTQVSQYGDGGVSGTMGLVLSSQVLASMPASQMSTLSLFKAFKYG